MLRQVRAGTPEAAALLDRSTRFAGGVDDEVAMILADVRARGDAAVADHARRLDRREPPYELARDRRDALAAQVAPRVRDALELAAARIRAFHERQVEHDLELVLDGVRLELRVTPLARVGIYVPGGTARYPSSVLMTAVQHRFRADAQLLRTFVAKGELGEIHYAKAGWLRRRTEWDSDEWRRQKRESGGGVVLDLGFQMLDLSLWTLGSPGVTSVTASVHRAKKGDVEDSATAFLRLATGATLTLELTWGLLMEKDFAYLNLFGAGGAALLNPFRLHKGMHGTLVNVTPDLDNARNQYKQSMEAQVLHFVESLRKGSRPMGGADEIVAVMEVLDAVYRSAEQGKEVRLA